MLDQELAEIAKRTRTHQKTYPWRYLENSHDFLARDRAALLGEVEKLRAQRERILAIIDRDVETLQNLDPAELKYVLGALAGSDE